MLPRESEIGKVPCIDDFIGARADADSTLDFLTRLLAALEAGETRDEAVRSLHSLADKISLSHLEHLMIRAIDVPGLEAPIRLFLTPAVFSPELWGQTFAEGLLKFSQRFAGARVVELGTGSGWISLLLLAKTQVKEVIGLDINPVAVTVSRLNSWLNGTRSDGSIVLSQAGQPIIGSFRVYESDLLGKVLADRDTFEHIIGCIPQVLHPGRSDEDVEQRLSERELYDLSNYCFEQGILEDRFGLPLIARALEQAQLCLKPEGEVTLILGGRPGPHAIESMFSRRGFESEIVWSRRIPQADDTDLASLVELENAHDIQFHFFMNRDSRESISADTAVRLLKSGRQVSHDLLVYRAKTRFETPTFHFVRNLHELGLDSLRRELDFSRMTEEQMSFLERLSREVMKSKTIPYPHERGDRSLRDRLASFLKIYCHVFLDPENLFVAPERSELFSMILNTVKREDGTILLSESLRPVYGNLIERMRIDVTWCNEDLSEIIELDEALRPSLSLVSPRQWSRPSPITLRALFDHAFKNPKRWYIVDDSANFEIGSSLDANIALRLAGQMDIPDNVLLLYGLVKNTVCPDLELSFLINAPVSWTENFDVASEISYSRIPYPSQLYYEWLFDDLLSFPFPVSASTSQPSHAVGESDRDDSVKELQARFAEVAQDAVFAPKPISVEDPELIRLDYGELEQHVPDLLLKGLIKGFVEEPSEALPSMMRHRASSYVATTRGVLVTPDRIALGQGVFPLLAALVMELSFRLGRPPVVAVPRATYGYIFPLITYNGGTPILIETDESNGFLVTAEQIAALNPKPDLLWLTQPNNPSGLLFDSTAVNSITTICAEKEIYILADEIFFLLSDYRLGTWTPSYVSFGSALTCPVRSRYLFITDGTSKAFAAGGLRCGFMVCPDHNWASRISSSVPAPPKSILRAWDSIYSAFLDEAPHGMMDLEAAKREVHGYLFETRRQLSVNRDEVLSLLREFGIDDGIDTPYRGGIFVLAKMSEHRDELAKKMKLLVNSDTWGRTPGWSRVCFSLPTERFQEATSRLRAYLSRTRSKESNER